MDVSPIDVPSPFPLGAKQASSLRRTRNLPVPYLLEREVYLPVSGLGLGLGAKSYLFGFVSKAVAIMGRLKYHLRQRKDHQNIALQFHRLCHLLSSRAQAICDRIRSRFLKSVQEEGARVRQSFLRDALLQRNGLAHRRPAGIALYPE